MLENTQEIVVGLSGGADSVALTHFLYLLTKKYNYNFKITAVHVNHGIRGEEALRDENFVKEFCEKLNINLVIRHKNIIEISKKLRISTEEAGRITRYNIFREISMSKKNCKIATAHTLSDNIETIIMRLLNGTGLKGLCGIPAVRDNIIRPLINLTRSQIEQYCEENSLIYIQDSTNFERDYTRNKIRLDIIPEFRKINPDFEICMKRNIDNFICDENYLCDMTNNIFENIKNNSKFDIKKINELPDCFKSRIIFKIINFYDLNIRLEQKHVNNIIDFIEKSQKNNINNLKYLSIPGDKYIVIRNNMLSFEYKKNVFNDNYKEILYKFNLYNDFKDLNIVIKIDIINKIEYERLKKGGNLSNNLFFVDYDKLNLDNIYFRNRRAGDKFEFKNRNISKSVKKIFNEYKIPVEIRDKILILESDNNIVWIDNIGVSRNYVVTNSTKKVMIICKN